jgi:hypothetical protein
MESYLDSTALFAVAPVDTLIELFRMQFPALMALIPDAGGDSFAVVMTGLTILVWVTLILIASLGTRILLRVFDYTESILSRAWFSFAQVPGRLRIRCLCLIKGLFGNSSTNRFPEVTDVQIDKLDLVVLKATASVGAGLATSAADLAEVVRIRPGKIQQALERLDQQKLVDRVIGATDGFQNYRLSESGAYFVGDLHQPEPGDMTAVRF